MPEVHLRYGANLAVPLIAIAYACISQGLDFYSFIPVVIVTIFAVIQACLRFYLLDVVYDYFKACSRVTQYWVSVGIMNGFIGLGAVQLYVLVR